MQLSLKMEPSTLGAGEAMADSDMVTSYVTQLALIILCFIRACTCAYTVIILLYSHHHSQR